MDRVRCERMMSNHLTGGAPATPPPLAKVCHLVFVACPIERCAVWEGERAVHRYATPEGAHGALLGSGLGGLRGRGVRQCRMAHGMVAAIAVAMVVSRGLRDRPSKRATATAAMAAMVVRERYRMLDGNGGDGDGDGGDDDGSNGVDGDGG